MSPNTVLLCSSLLQHTKSTGHQRKVNVAFTGYVENLYHARSKLGTSQLYFNGVTTPGNQYIKYHEHNTYDLFVEVLGTYSQKLFNLKQQSFCTGLKKNKKQKKTKKPNFQIVFRDCLTSGKLCANWEEPLCLKHNREELKWNKPLWWRSKNVWLAE